jgi:hypothetical protein
MRQRIAALSPEPKGSPYRSARDAQELGNRPPSSEKSRARGSVKHQDMFSAKGWVKSTPFRENTLDKVIQDLSERENIASMVRKTNQSGVPYTFVATKRGRSFLMRPDSDRLIDLFIEGKFPFSIKERFFFCSFVEANSAPVFFGDPAAIEKTGASPLLRSYLLQPQRLDNELQLASRVLFQSLFDASGLSSSFPGFLQKLKFHSDRDDVWYAQRELLIDTASLENTFFLKTLLDLGFSANSFSSVTGSWAVTVARLHNRDESLKLLSEHGADMEVREKTPM